MLKYQVRTLNRGQSSRKSLFDEDSSFSSQGSLSQSGNSDASFRLRNRSSSISSLSSAGSSTESPLEWGTIKVHTQALRADTDYKTVFISTASTSSDLVRMILAKFRLGNKDPKLFYVSMEILTRAGGIEVENMLVLDSSSKPLELQNCHPKDKSRFVLKTLPGALVRIYDYCITPESNYKSILISRQTTCSEAVSLVLQCQKIPYNTDGFVLVSMDTRNGCEFIMPPDAYLLSMIDLSPDCSQQVHLRPFTKARFSLSSHSSSKFHRFPMSQRPILEVEQLTTHIEHTCI